MYITIRTILNVYNYKNYFKRAIRAAQHIANNVLLYQLKLIKMHAKLGTLNHRAVPFLSRAGANLCWYYYTRFRAV